MSADPATARYNMVESQVRVSDVTDLRIQDAMRAVPRESLVPPAKAHAAYADTEVEYAPGRWLLKPRDVAKLLQALNPQPGETVLAIAAPYAAAVLEAMGLIVTRLDDSDLTTLPAGRYDLIVCEGGVVTAPKAWTEALVVGGRLGVVERSGPAGQAALYLRTEDGVGRRDLFDAMPPVMPEFRREPGFAF